LITASCQYIVPIVYRITIFSTIAAPLLIITIVCPTFLYICFECFKSSFPQSLGGNPCFFVFKDKWIPDYYLGNDDNWSWLVILGLDPWIHVSLFFKDNGFPITTSGMTTIGHGLSSSGLTRGSMFLYFSKTNGFPITTSGMTASAGSIL
jgi:hypothetical protein